MSSSEVMTGDSFFALTTDSFVETNAPALQLLKGMLATTGSIPCRMQHPSVPCLNVGTPRKLIWLPAEICHICAGQRRLKLDERQVTEDIFLFTFKGSEPCSAL